MASTLPASEALRKSTGHEDGNSNLHTATLTNSSGSRSAERPASGDGQGALRGRRRVLVAPWADLPGALVVLVASYLPCRADRVHVAAVNKHWHAAMKEEEHHPPQLPWLMFPSTSDPLFYSTIGEKTHKLSVPELVQPRRHTLYNINSGQRIVLPSTCVARGGKAQPLPFVRTAVLSASPAPGAYLIAAIVTVSNGIFSSVAIWQDHMEHWDFCRFHMGEGSPEDVIFHNGAFYFVASFEQVLVQAPKFGHDGKVKSIERRHYADVGRQRYPDERWGAVWTRYLVESGGELLMVVRKRAIDRLHTGRPSALLSVYMFSVDQHHRASWADVGRQLDGRALFIGRGCSRSFEVVCFHGGTIYFLDDTTPPYDCHTLTDMGRFSMAEMCIQPWPPVDRKKTWPESCRTSPPVWLLH